MPSASPSTDFNLQPLAFIDLETTGLRTTKDRITEIAIIRYQNGQELDRWSQLINPKMKIPEQIQHLTGIHQAMVDDAPEFKEVIDIVRGKLQGFTLVAHNARFDYGFLRNEFNRVNEQLHCQVLCTVKLSRRLFPKQQKHNLDALLAAANIPSENRHRAMSDTQALVGWFNSLPERVSIESINDGADQVMRQQALPSHIDPGQIMDIPDTAGVYLFYGENELPLYVGKSVTLRSRIRSHFYDDRHSNKEMQLLQQVRHIEYRSTAGELGALLLEASLVKQLCPVFNRQLRKKQQLVSLQWNGSIAQTPQVVDACRLNLHQCEQFYGLFRNKRDADQTLRKLSEEFRLCLKKPGLEKGKGACFGSQIGRCDGVCAGKEDEEIYLQRQHDVLNRIRLNAWPYPGALVIEEIAKAPYIGFDGKNYQSDFLLFDNWRYLGRFNSLEQAKTTYGDKQISDNLPAFDRDIYKILISQLKKQGEHLHLIPLEA
ncbi:exonuclease domain-containing protein [Oceanospirillum beijerinckii]|uniref:exonuclease domain-containing protein n=1 Tax=Oceanospirillum beijerinckii TaxID=64976 RepID=UPI00041FE8FB|nr:exonuclease domain-containing protein [Oceanospirillum beijerinckii]